MKDLNQVEATYCYFCRIEIALKFVYSEKEVEISQTFVAFSEYMNFTTFNIQKHESNKYWT